MKSEAKANQDLQTRAEAMQYEKAQWGRVLAAPKVSRPEARKQSIALSVPVVQKSFFSRLFGA